MKTVFISLGEFSLEAVHHPAPKKSHGGVVLCHPHPQFGGTMENLIVTAVEEALVKSGWAVLKFNFRGVGKSGGEYGEGAGEVADVRAAVDYLRGQEGEQASPLYVVGYSFGAGVALQACLRNTEIAGFVGIAPPLAMFPLDDFEKYAGGFFLIVGNRDSFVPLAPIQEIYRAMSEPKDLVVLPECDHFFYDLEDEVARTVRDFLERARKG